jgi:hypothetical protein
MLGALLPRAIASAAMTLDTLGASGPKNAPSTSGPKAGGGISGSKAAKGISGSKAAGGNPGSKATGGNPGAKATRGNPGSKTIRGTSSSKATPGAKKTAAPIKKHHVPMVVAMAGIVRNVISGRISGSVSRSETRPNRGRLPCMAVGPLSRSTTIKGEASWGIGTNVRRAHSAPTNPNT